MSPGPPTGRVGPIARNAPDDRLRWTLAGLFLLGMLLRLAYVHATPLDERGHDIYAHTDYIDYVETHRSIPPAAEGWEFYQPPLYYAGAAAWSAGAHALGYGTDAVHRQLQWISALLSAAATLLAFGIGRLLFHPKEERTELLLFCALLAVWPGLVLFSSRVSNDALHLVVSYASLWVLLLWWRGGKRRSWYEHATLTGLGLLVKISAVIQLPVALTCLAFRRTMKVRQKTGYAVGMCLVIVACAGWYGALRLTEADTTSTLRIGNTAMDPAIRLATTPASFLVFRPLSVVAFPYNNPWSDLSGRQFYWEYLFKSSLFGEWRFGAAMASHARAVSSLALGLLLLAIIGLAAELRRRPLHALPVHASLAFLLAASMTYRFLFACACNQDFRFVPLLVVPFAYYAVRGMGVFGGFPRSLAFQWIAVFVVAASAFLLRVGLTAA